MSKIDTEENRFHALKFAAQTLGAAHPAEVVQAANLYLDFLEGRRATTAEQAEAEAQGDDTEISADDTELSDLTESYPADEPEPPVAVVDSWAAADNAISDLALVSELFEEGPHELSGVTIDGENVAFPLTIEEPTTIHMTVSEGWEDAKPGLNYGAEYTRAGLGAVEVDPTFEYVAAAVEQIASPPPPAPDATEEPELTDEQVERIEERLATPDPITAAEADPERELQTAGYVNVLPRHKWPWMGS